MRVLLVDDHHLFLQSLRNLLTMENIEVVGMAYDGFEALRQALSLKPDLILMDVKMPRCDGIEATRLIKAELPDCKIIMLTMSDDPDDLFAAVKNGASGYLLKQLKADQFFDYLREAEAGRAVFSHGFSALILERFKRAMDAAATKGVQKPCTDEPVLSARQSEILTLIAQGQTYKQVAAAVGISERTVKYHVSEILERLNLENRSQAIAYAAKLGLLPRS